MTRAGCANGVHVVAREARFSDVLASLAKALDFEVSFESANNPLVSLDVIAQPSDLLARMTPDANISAMQASDPRCPTQKRILKVWVLSAGSEGPRPAVVPAPLTLSETPEQKKLAQEGIDLYMRAHGVDPDANKSPTIPQ